MSQHDTLDWTLVFAALASETRREILSYLSDTGDETDMTTVADHLAAIDRTGDNEQTRILTSLYHSHFPILAHAGVVTWNAETKRVSLTPLAYQLPVGVVSPPAVRDCEQQPERQPGD